MSVWNAVVDLQRIRLFISRPYPSPYNESALEWNNGHWNVLVFDWISLNLLLIGRYQNYSQFNYVADERSYDLSSSRCRLPNPWACIGDLHNEGYITEHVTLDSSLTQWGTWESLQNFSNDVLYSCTVLYNEYLYELKRIICMSNEKSWHERIASQTTALIPNCNYKPQHNLNVNSSNIIFENRPINKRS